MQAKHQLRGQRVTMTVVGFRRKRALLFALVAAIQLGLITAQPGNALFFHYQPQQQQQQSGYNAVTSHHHHHQPQQLQANNQLQQLQDQQPQKPANNNNLQADELASSNQELPNTFINQQQQQQSILSSPSNRALSLQQQPPPQSQQLNQQQQQQSGPPPPSIGDGSPIFRYHGMAINSTTVKLVWNLVHGTHAEYFEIKHGPIPDTEISTVRLNGTARDYTIHQLQPDTLYQFRLQGFGSNEQRYRPALVAVKTSSINPKSLADSINRDIMPLGVKAEAKSNNSIQLSWIEPEKPATIKNSIRVNIIRYYINPSLIASAAAAAAASSSATNQQEGSAATTTNSTTTPQYHYLNVTNQRESRVIVQRLKPATEYAFAVKTAYYSPDMRRMFMQSGFSMDTIAKTFDLEPSAPRNFTVQEMALSKDELARGQMPKLELSWQPPESPNGQLKGYVILHSHDQNLIDEKWLRISVNDSNINNWYVSNLRPGAYYYFKMRALNQRGHSGDSETRLYVAPSPPQDKIVNMPIPASNVLMMVAIILILIVSVLSIIVYQLFCNTRKSRKPARAKGLQQQQQAASSKQQHQQSSSPKLNGFASTNSSSTVTARVGTLARRRQQQQTTADGAGGKPDFWISAMDHSEVKSNISEKSNSDINMAAMVSLQRDSPQQFITQTQLAPVLPDYRLSSVQQQQAEQQLMQQLHHQQQQQQQGHYHAGHFTGGPLAFDQMDNATASALMTLSKRQQQQLQKYQIQFAATGQVPAPPQVHQQAPSPHQQPPPPPPLNIEQQQQQHLHQQQQSLYGTHHQMANTRSLRLHRPTMYDPVSGSFVQSGGGGPTQPNDGSQPPNYNSHLHQLFSNSSANNNGNNNFITSNSNTLQFHHPHQTSTLLSRRSTNTFRSFQTAGLNNNNNNATYGQLGSFGSSAGPLPPNIGNGQQQQQQQQPQQLLQSHQAVINQLNNSAYPSSLPLKHVSAVRPQIMSSLEDPIEMELAEKEQQQQMAQDQQQKAIKQ